MGRSRGGLTTKIDAQVDACGLPILLKPTEGQAHDGRSAQDMLGPLGRLNKLKHFRVVATRCDKRDGNYLASVKLASIRNWMCLIDSMA